MTGAVSVPLPRRITGPAAGDEELVELIRDGDDRAFEVLFERYQGRITAYVRGMVRDHARAEDITQEVFLNALRRLRATDSTIAFRPWIYEIAKNACIDSHRRSRRVQEISYDADESMAPADSGKLVSPRAVPETVETRESLENLQGAIGALSESHADVLVLRELEGLSYREIGERLGMSRASVESTLFRARKRLEAEYADLVSGERCRQIQASFAAIQGSRPRLRDRRQVSRHLAWCQPCRHQARLAGLDIEVSQRIPLRTKVGGLIPIPMFVRGWFLRGATQGQAYAGAGDSLMEWGRAAAAAAVVAVVGVGAGAVIDKGPVVDGFGYAPKTTLNSGGTVSAPVQRVTALLGVERAAGTVGVAPVAGPGGAGALGAPLAAGPLAPSTPAGTEPAGLGTTGSLPAGTGQAAGEAAQATGVALGRAAAGVGGTVNGLGQTVGGAVGGVTQTTGGAVRGVTQTTGGGVRDATRTVGGTVRGVTETGGGLVRNVTQNPTNLGGAVNETVRGTTQTVGQTVRGTTGTVNGTVQRVPESANDAVRGTTGTVDQAVQGVTQTTNSTVQGVVGSLTPPAVQPAPAAPAPTPAPAATQSAPAPAPATEPVREVVQDTTGAVGGLLGGR